MTEALIVSQGLLWIVILALAVAVLALARQVGVLYERIAPAGALAINRTLKVGDPAPGLTVETLAGRRFEVAAGGAQARLYFFLSPTCPVCKTLLPALRSLARGERRKLEVILASDGEARAHRAFIRLHRLESFDYVLSEPLGREMGVSRLPYAVLVNEAGRVAGFGIVNSREHLESLVEARERGVASIQDYIQATGTASAPASATTGKEVVRATS